MRGVMRMDKKDVSVTINLDTTPILYTDSILMVANDDGVMLDVGQKVGDQLRIVSRIGMSRTQAKKFVEELANLLAITTEEKQKVKKN